MIRIELRLDGSLPTGLATAEDGGARVFTGWVSLISAVDALSAADTFEVRARDAAGQVDASPATTRFKSKRKKG